MPGLSHSDLIKLLTVFPAGADLRDAACSRALFREANLTGARMRRAHLSQALLQETIFADDTRSA
jgi:uncharacterized protein YjbI with pentapeptide repeats